MKRKCQYCGNEQNVFLLQFRLLFVRRVYSTCKECGRTSAYRMVAHYPHDSTDELEKEFNKHFEESKRGIWKL